MTATLVVVVLGVIDVERAARFWTAALGYDVHPEGYGGWSTILVPRNGSGARIALQRSESAPEELPRQHLDLHVATSGEQSDEAKRLVSIGAQRVAWDRYPADPDFVVLADTEGNRFCVVNLGHPHR